VNLTAREWWALAAAIALREEYLDEQQEKGLPVGKDRAALRRAEEKVRAALLTDRSWRPFRNP
jgi:hypothetical protein